MSYLLDTDICSAFLKGNKLVWGKVMQHGGQLHVSAISVGELFTWTFRKGVSPKRRIALQDFLRSTTILEVTAAIGEKFGELRAQFLDAGQATPDMDLVIAATALCHNFTIVTHNVKDYASIVGLDTEDWLNP